MKTGAGFILAGNGAGFLVIASFVSTQPKHRLLNAEALVQALISFGVGIADPASLGLSSPLRGRPRLCFFFSGVAIFSGFSRPSIAVPSREM
jgi:hypothetical protein